MVFGLRYAAALLVFAAYANAQPPLREVNGRRAFEVLLRQCAFGPRNPGSPGHAACRAYLAERLTTLTDTVELMHFQPIDSHGNRLPPMTNLIGWIAPKNPKRYLVCAHWDTRPRADHDPDPARRREPILGANDGASGVAVLLEVAAILKKFPPPVGVDIVLFDGEDGGEDGSLDDWLLGSRELARRWLEYRPELGILVDMVGDKDLHLPEEGISAQAAPWLVNRVWDAAARIGEPAFERRVGQRVFDDHLPLIEAGWPVIDIIDFEYPYWHTHADTPDKCSAESLAAVMRVLIALIYGY